MNRSLRSFLFAAIAFAAVVCLGCIASDLHAQDAPAAAAAAPDVPVVIPAPDEAPAAAVDFLGGLLAKYPAATTALAVFGFLSVAYQALIAAAHKHAAATASDLDDKWIATLEAKWWFRVLDRVFYWGGYLGAKLGGKKL